MDSVSLYQGDFKTTLLGSPIRVDVEVSKSWRTVVDFSLLGVAYTFSIDAWRSKRFTPFVQLFHDRTNGQIRDPGEYGRIATDDEGLVNVEMTHQQKLKCVLAATRDVMACLDKIGTHHQRSVLDYAVWYRDKHPERTTYSELITLTTCHCIVHTDFLAPNQRWELVQF